MLCKAYHILNKMWSIDTKVKYKYQIFDKAFWGLRLLGLARVMESISNCIFSRQRLNRKAALKVMPPTVLC